MIEMKGKYNEAKIFTDVVDSASIAQVQELCNQEFTAGSRIRLMPDIHAGAGCTIGTTMTITDKVVPNLVGVDIGCGMETTRIREGRLELQKLDKLIYEKIPSGFSIRDKAHRYLNEIDLSELCCARHVDLLRAEKSIGTQGGGNHFIEEDKDDEGNLYIVVHSGSRHLGVEVASYYQEAGYKVLNRTDDASLQALVAQMKAEGRETEIQKELKKLKNLKQTSIPKALAYVSGELFEQYIHDMKIVQHFAMLNRQAMMDEIVKGMKLHVEEQFTTIHNYIDTDAMILRKGAVSAKAGEQLLIPIGLARYGGSTEEAMAGYGTIHGMVFPILMFPAAILYSVSDLLVPELSRCRAMGRALRVRDLSGKCIRMTILFAAAVAGFFFVCAEELGQCVYHSADAGRYLRIFAPMVLMLYLDAIVDGMLKGLAEQLSCVRYNTLTSVLDVVFLYVLLPRHGVAGYVAVFAVTHAINLYLSIRRLLVVTEHRPRTADFALPLLSLGLALLLTPPSPAMGGWFVRLLCRGGWFLTVLLAAFVLLQALTQQDGSWLRRVLRRTLDNRGGAGYNEGSF